MTRDDPSSAAETSATKRRRATAEIGSSDAVSVSVSDRDGLINDEVPAAKKLPSSSGSQTRSKQKSSPVTTLVDHGGEARHPDHKDGEDADKATKSISQSTRSSSRSQKKLCCDAGSSPTTYQTARKPESTKQGNISDQVKTRRSWELWSVDDKNTFFEALCEYGKDFESIQHYIAQKNKKKSHLPQLIKNKDQVRHFYYRTWHKISKYLDITDDIKKPTQELYGLINYGELRKKIGGRMDEKNGQKLNELVHHGATSMRCRGKNFRVKTPICRALKKLNLVADPKEEQMMKLPSRLTVEFQPRTNAAWAQVQSAAQNPRLRMTMSLQRRLSSVIAFLQRKWKPHRLKQKDNLAAGVAEFLAQAAAARETLCLRVLPRKDASVTLVTMRTASETIKSNNVSLQSYRTNVADKDAACAAAVDVPKKMGRGKSKAAAAAAATKHVVVVDEVKPCAEEKLTDTDAHPVNGEGKASSKNSAAGCNIELMLKKLMEPKRTEVSETRANEQSDVTQNCVRGEQNKDDVKASAAAAEDDLRQEKCTNDTRREHDERVSRVRKGWNLTEAGTMTIGELYILMGYPSTLQLEYAWESEPASDAAAHPRDNDNSREALGSILRKLLQMACNSSADNLKGKQVGGAGGGICRCNVQCALHSNSPKASSARAGASSRAGTKIAKGPPPAAAAALDADAQKLLPCAAVQQNVFLVPSSHAPRSSQANLKTPVSPLQQKKLLPTDTSFRDQLDKLLPQNRKARGNLRKSVVVQRELSLLPKTRCASSMMTLRIVPSASNLAGSFVPVLPVAVAANPATIANVLKLPASKVLTTAGSFAQNVFEVKPASATSIVPPATRNDGAPNFTAINVPSSPVLKPVQRTSSLISVVPSVKKIGIDANVPSTPRMAPCIVGKVTLANAIKTIPSTTTVVGTLSLLGKNASAREQPVPSFSNKVPSPPSISSLLDLSLPACESLQTVADVVPLGNAEKLLDISLGNSNSSFMDSHRSVLMASPTGSMFKGHSVALENAWLGGETEDISLSSLLGHLESPHKQMSIGAASTLGLISDAAPSDSISQLSNDVDTQLQCMMNENSVDYIAKFADLAAQIATSETPKKSATSL